MVPDPLPGDSFDVNKDIAAAGFQRHHELRLSMWEQALEVWCRPAKEEGFLLCLTLGDKCEMMLATDFPSLLELIAKLKPAIDLQYRSHVAETLSDLYALLTDYEGCGPLGDALSIRDRERKEETKKLRAALSAARDAKENG